MRVCREVGIGTKDKSSGAVREWRGVSSSDGGRRVRGEESGTESSGARLVELVEKCVNLMCKGSQASEEERRGDANDGEGKSSRSLALHPFRLGQEVYSFQQQLLPV